MGIIAALACISVVLVIDGFEPFGGPGDAQIFEYTGYYFFQHLRFGAWPVLTLDTARIFYPYGTNAVFQPWGLERDMFHAGLRLFFGAGPWLSVYYLFSIVVSAVGAYLLAVSELGGVSAFLLGLSCSVLNFHPMAMVRDQPGYSMVHWTELGIIVDFLIARRVTEQRSLTMDLVVTRALLLVLSLGLDLTYVAGYSLLSLSALLVYLVALLGFRAAQRRKSDFARPSDAAPLIALDRRLHLRHVAMLAITGAFLWLYVPVLVKISRAASSFDFSHIESGTMWVSPLRLLVPLFPRVYPEGPVDAAFHDAGTHVGFEGTPGWCWVVLALLGVRSYRGSRLALAPIFAVFLTCLAYRKDFETLNVLPWFRFFRVGGRSTSFYPVMLALMASGIPWSERSRRSNLLWLTGLALLGAVEAFTAYGNVVGYPRYKMDSSGAAYMRRLQHEPGAAVLDWPFCTAGGNGVGVSNLCLSRPQQLALFAYQRFHEKDVLGGYMGRLHPTQIQPYLDAGWDRMLESSRPGKENACFDLAGWRFFEDFFRLNDFAGINLWVDFLSPSCVAEFQSRFGSPIFRADFAGVGSVEFLPKRPRPTDHIDPERGRRLRLDEYHPQNPIPATPSPPP